MRAVNDRCCFEREACARGYRRVAGIDEAGRGPLAGPVIAAAVILPPDYQDPEINDSKTLTSRQRERLYEVIQRDAIAIGIGVVEAATIDTLNILRATMAAMKEAVIALVPQPDYLLIDGLYGIPLAIPQQTIVRGDGQSISVASASIMAKVSRDRIMEMYHRQFPQYNFLHNKGYATREHREAIVKYGRCKIHRNTFRIAAVDDLYVNASLEF
mgnify:CR=1 FL=1